MCIPGALWSNWSPKWRYNARVSGVWHRQWPVPEMLDTVRVSRVWHRQWPVPEMLDSARVSGVWHRQWPLPGMLNSARVSGLCYRLWQCHRCWIVPEMLNSVLENVLQVFFLFYYFSASQLSLSSLLALWSSESLRVKQIQIKTEYSPPAERTPTFLFTDKDPICVWTGAKTSFCPKGEKTAVTPLNSGMCPNRIDNRRMTVDLCTLSDRPGLCCLICDGSHIQLPCKRLNGNFCQKGMLTWN